MGSSYFLQDRRSRQPKNLQGMPKGICWRQAFPKVQQWKSHSYTGPYGMVCSHWRLLRCPGTGNMRPRRLRCFRSSCSHYHRSGRLDWVRAGYRSRTISQRRMRRLGILIEWRRKTVQRRLLEVRSRLLLGCEASASHRRWYRPWKLRAGSEVPGRCKGTGSLTSSRRLCRAL